MTKVIIVDDQNTILEFLKVHLGNEPDIQIIAVANDGKDAISLVNKYRPDVVLMDIDMPIMNGIEASKVISQKYVDTKVVLLTSQDDRKQLDFALKAGARGYILKNTNPKDIVKILRLTEKGFFQIGPILHSWDYPEPNNNHSNIQTYTSEYPKTFQSNGNASTAEMQRMLSNLTSGIFELQETIQSQENTIVNLTHQYSEVQQEIRERLSDKRLLSNIRNNYYRARKGQLSLTERKQNTIFVSSFFLGVATTCVVLGIVFGVGMLLP